MSGAGKVALWPLYMQRLADGWRAWEAGTAGCRPSTYLERDPGETIPISRQTLCAFERRGYLRRITPPLEEGKPRGRREWRLTKRGRETALQALRGET